MKKGGSRWGGLVIIATLLAVLPFAEGCSAPAVKSPLFKFTEVGGLPKTPCDPQFAKEVLGTMCHDKVQIRGTGSIWHSENAYFCSVTRVVCLVPLGPTTRETQSTSTMFLMNCDHLAIYKMHEKQFFPTNRCWDPIQKIPFDGETHILKEGILDCGPGRNCSLSLEKTVLDGNTYLSGTYMNATGLQKFENLLATRDPICPRNPGLVIILTLCLSLITLAHLIRVLLFCRGMHDKPFPSKYLKPYTVGLDPEDPGLEDYIEIEKGEVKVTSRPSFFSKQAWTTATPTKDSLSRKICMPCNILLTVAEPTLWEHLKHNHPMLSIFYATKYDPFTPLERMLAFWSLAGLNCLWVAYQDTLGEKPLGMDPRVFYIAITALALQWVCIKPWIILLGLDFKRWQENILTCVIGIWLLIWGVVVLPLVMLRDMTRQSREAWLASMCTSLVIMLISSIPQYFFKRALCGVKRIPEWHKVYAEKAGCRPYAVPADGSKGTPQPAEPIHVQPSSENPTPTGAD